MSQTLFDAWAKYRAQVVPEDAGKNQIIETRAAFYAGAVSAIAILVNLPADATDQEIDRLVVGLLNEATTLAEETIAAGSIKH